MMPEEQKKEGICYRLGGPVSVEPERGECTAGRASGTVQPAFYGSIQEYANACDEEYNAVISQISEALDAVRKDVAEYQQMKKAGPLRR